MKHWFATVLAPVALLACGSSGEPELLRAESQSVTTFCPIDYVYKCSELSGRQVCGCVYTPPPPPPPPVCNFVVDDTGGPGLDTWIEGWAVESFTGQCSDIPGSGGTWKKLVPELRGPFCFNGVPNDYVNPAGYPSCESFFPSGNCCTYVWWPDTFVEPATCPVGGVNIVAGQPIEDAQLAQAPQDTQALCAGNTSTWFALERSVCVGGFIDGGAVNCALPGGGTCGTCSSGSAVR